MSDNNQGRILSPRKRLHGSMDSLENIIGPGVGDGVGCYVIEAGANYRYHAQCDIEADGYFVVKPNGTASGKWLRESGSLAVAILSHDGAAYQASLMVQFEFEATTGTVRYVGGTSRPAFVALNTNSGVSVVRQSGPSEHLFGSALKVMLYPGDMVVLPSEVSLCAINCL